MQRIQIPQDTTRTVALLDVDDTLIIDPALSPGYPGYREVKLEEKVNNILLNSLKDAQIRDVYLFTDMNLKQHGIEERKALVEILKAKGFVVHGVITPADPSWHLRESELKEVDELKEIHHFPEDIKRLKQAIKRHQTALEKLDREKKGTAQEKLSYSSEIKENESKIKNLENDLQKILVNSAAYAALMSSPQPTKILLGQPFKDAEAALQEQKVLDGIGTKGYLAADFTELQSVVGKMDTRKGKMFQFFLEHQSGFNRVIVADDRLDVLHSIEQANATHPKKLETTTLYVNQHHKIKRPGEVTKNQKDYLNELNAPRILKIYCLDYKNRLEQYIKIVRESKSGDESVCDKSTKFVLAKAKVRAIDEMLTPLSNPTIGEKQIGDFKNKFLEHRALIETARDTCSMLFVKGLATVLTLGVAAYFGIWHVKGRDLTSKMTSLLPVEEKLISSIKMN